MRSETIPQELESVSHIEDISEDIDFEITVDFIEEESSKKTLDEVNKYYQINICGLFNYI